MQSSKDSSKFGAGDIRGVLAPEAANNALRGGALIPTLSMGIPGSVGTAVLLGALIMLGLRPGTSMLSDNLDVTLSMVWQIALASVLATLMLFATAKHLSKIAFIPSDLLVPGVLLFIFMGAWLSTASIGDWVSCTLFGALGFAMKRGGWPRPPIVLALVLGGILESSFQISMRIHRGVGWLSRPIVIVILLIIAASIFMGWRRQRKLPARLMEASDEDRSNPVISLPITLLLLCLFIWAGLQSLPWPLSVKQLPVLVATIGGVLSLLALLQDSRDLLSARSTQDGWRDTVVDGARRGMLPQAAQFLAYLVGLILLTLTLGMKIALPLTLLLYLRFWGQRSFRLSLTYGIVVWIVIVGFYDHILGLTFYPSWLGMLLQSRLPGEWLRWLF